jgi:hypothetical protein
LTEVLFLLVHGERKAEIVSVRREDMRGHGSGRGNISSVENGMPFHFNINIFVDT